MNDLETRSDMACGAVGLTRRNAEQAEMAKSQKTFYLDDELDKLLRRVARVTGAPFTKSITAAVLAYLFNRPEGPDPYWMELAVALDEGEITLDDVIKDRHETARLERGTIIDLENDNPTGHPTQGLVNVVEHFSQLADSAEDGWEAMLARKGVAAAKVINHWSEIHSRRHRSTKRQEE